MTSNQNDSIDHIADSGKMVGEVDRFCDLNCTWLDHHPDCTIAVGYLGFSPDGHKNKFRSGQFGNSVPVYAHPPSYEKLKSEIDQARQIITELIHFCERPEIVAATDGAFDPDAVIQRGKRFLSGGEG